MDSPAPPPNGVLAQSVVCGYDAITAGPLGLHAAAAAYKPALGRFVFWCGKRRARRLPRQPRQRRGELGESPTVRGYYTISGNRKSGFPAAAAAGPGRSRGIWFNKRGARRLPRQPRQRRGELGESPTVCGYYTISGNRKSGFPAAAAAGPGRSRGIWFNKRGARRLPRQPRQRRGELGESPIVCGYCTTFPA